MTDWHLVWLGTIAICLVFLVAVQLALMGAALIILRQVSKAIGETRREIKPLVEKVHRIADDAARATALAVTQVERVDQFMSSTAERVDEVFGVLQHSILAPLRQGGALLAAIRAAIAVFGDRQQRTRHGRDDDDALFIG